MNVFYEELPDSVVVSGKSYKIITDFREWIKFSDMIKSDIPNEFKYEFISEMFLEEINLSNVLDEVLESFVCFLSMTEIEIPKQNSGKGKKQKNIISLEYDAPYIISSFKEYYDIDLLNVKYMHWWKFKMLLNGLPEESSIKKRMYYRDVDLGDIKDKYEKKRIMKIKKAIDLPENELTDGDIGNAF